MPEASIGRPAEDEYFQFYAGYVSNVPETDPLAAMTTQGKVTQALLGRVGEQDSLYRYAADKWSIKEVVGHLCDTERIMAYRALRIGRGDEKPLQGFEQNDYVRLAETDRRHMAELLQELAEIRRTTLSLFRGFPAEAWRRRGTASDHPISLRALAFVIPGHERAHLQTLQTRYGLK